MNTDPEHRGFAEPDEDIVTYANANNIHLDLRSTVVQRMLRLRIAMGLPKEEDKKNKPANSRDWLHWQEQ